MDFPSFNSTNMLNDTNANVASDDIADKYITLKKQYEAVMKTLESTKQELYDKKRSYETSLGIQEHLKLEIESYELTKSKKIDEYVNKIQTLEEEVQSLREERNINAEANQNQIEKLEKKLDELEEKISLKDVELKIAKENIVTPKSNDRNALIMKENEELKEAILVQKEALEENKSLVLNLNDKISELNAELMCIKSNLDSKKNELESATELLQATQNDLIMANCELQRLNAEGNDHASKGNSLFAEVEDKRQEMAKNLLHMKTANVQLKRELANKQAEIETLLCERKNIWKEFESNASISDAKLIESYEKRITHLESIVENQRRDITRWFSKCHVDPQLQLWLSGVMAHLRDRCADLTSDLMAASIDCLHKATQIRELHRQIAALKLKQIDPNHDVNGAVSIPINIPSEGNVKSGLDNKSSRKKVTF